MHTSFGNCSSSLLGLSHPGRIPAWNHLPKTTEKARLPLWGGLTPGRVSRFNLRIITRPKRGCLTGHTISQLEHNLKHDTGLTGCGHAHKQFFTLLIKSQLFFSHKVTSSLTWSSHNLSVSQKLERLLSTSKQRVLKLGLFCEAAVSQPVRLHLPTRWSQHI